MEITTEQIGAVTVARHSGDLDTATAGTADEALSAALEQGAQIMLVNLEAVGFVSSAGLRVLLSTAKRLSSPLRVCGLNETVQEVFDISGFTTIFDVYPDEQQGLDG